MLWKVSPKVSDHFAFSVLPAAAERASPTASVPFLAFVPLMRALPFSSRFRFFAASSAFLPNNFPICLKVFFNPPFLKVIIPPRMAAPARRTVPIPTPPFFSEVVVVVVFVVVVVVPGVCM